MCIFLNHEIHFNNYIQGYQVLMKWEMRIHRKFGHNHLKIFRLNCMKLLFHRSKRTNSWQLHIVQPKTLQWGFPGGAVGKNLPASEGGSRDSGLGRSPRERNGNPLQYSCLENFMDGLQSMGSQRIGSNCAHTQYFKIDTSEKIRH